MKLGFLALILVSCSTTKMMLFPTARLPLDGFYRDILRLRPELENLSELGPFPVKETPDFSIRISASEELKADLFMAQHSDKASLIIIQHGNFGSKAYHREQARRIASWGSHVLTLEQVNTKRWVHNGLNLAKLVILLQRWPDLLDSKFDPQKIILAGHSFGGSAIGIAAGSGINVRGLIFLDPALYNSSVANYLGRIQAPAFVLGADKRVFTSRSRSTFYSRIGRNVAEISVAGSTHNDAQFPNQFSWSQTLGLEQSPKADTQHLFTAAMNAIIMSYSVSGSWTEAWPLFENALRKGELRQPKKRLAVTPAENAK